MDKSLPSFAYLLETDLARKGLSQRDLAAKLTEQGEPPLTEQAISSWKARGKVPGKRMDRLLAILGPDSEVGKAHGQWQAPEKIETLRDTTIYPTRADLAARNYIRANPQHTGPILEAAIHHALPEALRTNWEKAIPVGAVTLRFDYISDNAVVEIKQISNARGFLPLNVYRDLFQLALAGRLHGDQRQQRNYGLIILATDGTAVQGIARIQFEASLMGLQLVVVDSPEKAAKQIEEWEKTPPEDLFSS